MQCKLNHLVKSTRFRQAIGWLQMLVAMVEGSPPQRHGETPVRLEKHGQTVGVDPPRLLAMHKGTTRSEKRSITFQFSVFGCSECLIKSNSRTVQASTRMKSKRRAVEIILFASINMSWKHTWSLLALSLPRVLLQSDVANFRMYTWQLHSHSHPATKYRSR
jgi:hypothetical protein